MEQNLNQYKIFYAVASAGSISKASENLYISQPAVSKSVSKLESSLGVTLLKRVSRGISLTEEGKALYEQLGIAFSAIEAGERKIKTIHGLGVGKIRIGVSASLCRYILLPYLKGFIEDNPHIRVTIDCRSSAQTTALLAQGKIDAAVAVKSDIISEENFIALGELEDIFVATPTYIDNLKMRTGADISDTYSLLSSADLMLLDEKNVTRIFVDEYLRSCGIEPNNYLEVTNMDLLIEFAKIGMGIACVIRQVASDGLKSGSIIEIPLEKPMKRRTVGIVFAKDKFSSAAAEKLKEWVMSNKDNIAASAGGVL